MKKRRRKLRKPVKMTIYIFLVTLIVYVSFDYFHRDKASVNEAKAEIKTGIDTEWLEEQADVEEQILEDSKGHSLGDPYIKLNPYGTSPLSALIIFETEEPSQISVTVKGKTADTDITEHFEEYDTYHEIPVLGLYADYQNTVEITAVSYTHLTLPTMAVV